MNTLETITKEMVAVYEKEQPKLCELVKQIVNSGESYNSFLSFIAIKFGKQWETSLTATMSLTLFKYYKDQSQPEK